MKYENYESAIPRPLAGIRAKFQAKRSVNSDPDDKILLAIREGETEAFGKLVNRYEDFVFTLVRGLVRSEEMTEDIAQETFLRAYRGIRRFELRSSFKTWLYRIAHNTAMSHLKRGMKDIGTVEAYEPSTIATIDHSLKLTLEKLIGRLKPDLRTVILFHYYDDLKYEEIAEVLECPVGTVKIRLYRAKHELKKLWTKYAV
ncbi:MAG: RNA polymerase sigma factor [candidate division Zixibacteria bacterium]